MRNVINIPCGSIGTYVDMCGTYGWADLHSDCSADPKGCAI